MLFSLPPQHSVNLTVGCLPGSFAATFAGQLVPDVYVADWLTH